MKLLEKAKLFLKIPGAENPAEIFRPQEKDLHPPVASYTNPNAPLTYAEMKLLVPLEMWNPKHPKHRAVFGLLQSMERQLQDARTVSTIQPEKYMHGFSPEESGTQTEFRIRGIQQQISAVQFRLSIHDYGNGAERAILENQMFELYQQAKEIDPDGVSRFERMVDKRMKKNKQN